MTQAEQNLENAKAATAKQKKKLESLQKETKTAKAVTLTVQEIETMGKKSTFGNNITLTPDECDTLKRYAVNGTFIRFRRVKVVQADYLIRVILIFVEVVLMPKIDVGLVQVEALADGGICDNCTCFVAKFLCNAAGISLVFEAHHEMDVRLFEVTDLPLRAVALMLFGVLHEFLLCVYVFVMQCPGAGPVGFYVVNGRLLALRVEGEDKLIGFCALGCWFRRFVPPLRFAFWLGFWLSTDVAPWKTKPKFGKMCGAGFITLQPRSR